MTDITREIWEKTDNVLLLFLGSTVDAVLDPAVMDWIYFSGGIVNEPFKRLFSTITYSRKLLNMSEEEMKINSDRLRKMHTKLEVKRTEETGQQHHISNESFLRVLSGIIDYGIRGYEYLNRKPMNSKEKEEFYQRTAQTGRWMHIEGVPKNYLAWEIYRKKTFEKEYRNNEYTERFYGMLREQFGWFGLLVIKNVQAMFVDPILAKKMGFKKPSWFFKKIYYLYPYVRNEFILKLVISIVVPAKGRKTVLEIVNYKPHSSSTV